MNKDAETEIERLKLTCHEDEVRYELSNLLRAAMSWAYNDAWKTCLAMQDMTNDDYDAGCYHCAQAIEARAKA